MAQRVTERKQLFGQVDEALPPPTTCGFIGLAGGVVGGFLGGGGGVVTIPALDHVTTLPRVRIHGTATLVNAVIAVVGTGVYSLHGGAVDWRTGVGLMLGGLVGAPLGARLAARLPERQLRLLFIAVLLLAGVKILFDAVSSGGQATSALLPIARTPYLVVLPTACLFGIVIGAWSSSLGLGGGLLAIPTLVLIFGISQHTAAGTSLLVMIPNTIVGSVAHLRQGTASPRLGSIMGIGALGGAALGSWIAFLLNDQLLQLIFGCFVLIMAIREGYTFYRRLRTDLKETKSTLDQSNR